MYNESEEGRLEIRSSALKRHPNYDPYYVTNDIGLIQLAETVQLNEKIQLSRLPSKQFVGESFAGEISTLSGWGKTADGRY